MHGSLAILTANIENYYKKLLRRYRPLTLHSLRVCIRRMRSMLKHIDNPRAQAFRKTWGGFAALTNDARDWDVFFDAAGESLTEVEVRYFRKLIRRHREASHKAVKIMLRSAQWQTHFDDWRRLVERIADRAEGAAVTDRVLQRTLATASLRLTAALEADDDRHWHKLRIAVKDVRYVVDACERGSATGPRLNELVHECKLLQTVLGKWHDATIQLYLLDDLTTARVPTRLRSVLKRRRRYYLKRTRNMLTNRDIFRVELK